MVERFEVDVRLAAFQLPASAMVAFRTLRPLAVARSGLGLLGARNAA